LNICFDLFLDERAVQGGIPAIQLAFSDGKSFVSAEVDRLIELHCDLLGPGCLANEQTQEKNRQPPQHIQGCATESFERAFPIDELRHGPPPR
jgi:hypothetical protein